MAPGECIVHDDAGEMRAQLLHKLCNDFGVDYRGIKSGRPWANGQAESAVKLVKNKIKMVALENGNVFFFLQILLGKQLQPYKYLFEAKGKKQNFQRSGME